MKKLVDLYCDVDDFCKVFIPQWEKQLLEDGTQKRQRSGLMTTSEIMTIVVSFHMSHYRDFKNYYLGLVCCHYIRIPRHKTFDGIAKRGKGTMGWFFGFKLHLIVNYTGEIVAAKVTTGNVHDTQPVAELAQGLTDKLYGYKGYLSKALEANLLDKGVKLITTVRKNMKAKAMSLWDRAMLSKRFIIETINDQLKNISYIEHSRHRSMNSFMLNLLAGLVTYCLKENKPGLNLTDVERNSMITA